MLLESCARCQQRQAEVRCRLCKRGYCKKCASFVNGLCSNCLKRQDKSVSDPRKKGPKPGKDPTYIS